MNRLEKQAFVENLTQNVSDAKSLILMSFTNLSVEKMTSFRLALRKNDIRVKVVKNTLAKRVLDKTEYKDISKELTGPTLLAYSSGDPVLTAKCVVEWASKENFNIKVKSGVALGQVMSETQIKSLAKLPGRNELLVSFLWALKSHPTRFLYALKDGPQRLGYAFGALKEKKEKESAK